MTVGQHANRAGKSIPVPTWTCLQADESIFVQKLNSPQGGKVRYTDAAAGQSNNDRGWSKLSSCFKVNFSVLSRAVDEGG